jgi:hypothetical protein
MQTRLSNLLLFTCPGNLQKIFTMSSDIHVQLQQWKERAEKAELRAEQERQRAEQAERLTRPTTLSEYLRGCHEGPYRAFSVQQDKSLTTQGSVTDPEGKICPTYLRHGLVSRTNNKEYSISYL